jgi:hypothetical protein
VSEGRIAKPLALFLLLLLALLGAVAVLGFMGGDTVGSSGVTGQSPPQFQPDAVAVDEDPETGEIRVEGGENKRILVDTQHDNEFSRAELEPILEAAFAAGHTVEFAGDEDVGVTEYSSDLGRYDGFLVIQPTEGFSADERDAIREFTDDGGRLVVLAEPTQTEPGGAFSAPSVVSFGAGGLVGEYGVTIGAEGLYNLNDSENDNNFKSIYAAPEGEDPLTEGVETVTFDTSGYLVTAPESDAEVLYTAIPGTRGLERRQPGTYPTVVRSGNAVVVADSSFLKESEVYDVDNEVFVGNLLTFLAEGTAPGPSEPDSDLDPEPGTDPTPTPEPGAEPTPTPEGTPRPTPAPGST